MNSLKNYFSPTKLSPTSLASVSSAQTPSSSNQSIACEIKENGLKPLTPKSSKTDSLKIISNMESVINSVKKKHRHRKKKEIGELNKSEPEITDISNILSNSLKFISPNTSYDNSQKSAPEAKENIVDNESKKDDRAKRNSRKKESTSAVKSRKNGQLKKHGDKVEMNGNIDQILLTKSSSDVVDLVDEATPAENGNIAASKVEKPDEKLTPKTNAFTLMMNARNRVIGSNQNGQDTPTDALASPSNPEKTKRKRMLEDWAEKKGRAKRKLEEIERGEYLDYQMEKRAKRLKRMLAGDKGTPKSKKNSKADNPKTDDNSGVLIVSSQETEVQEGEESAKRKRINGKMKLAKKQINLSTPDLKEALNSSAPSTSTSKAGPARRKRIVRAASLQSETSDREEQDNDFVQKLSSPIKKRDSLLGYFPKIISPKDDEIEDAKKSSPRKKNVEQQNLSKKRRQKVKNLKENTKSEVKISIAGDDTPSGRPRRSCSGRVRYEEETSLSPAKSDSNIRVKRRKSISVYENRRASRQDDDVNSVDVIFIDTTDDIVSEKKPTKLAPLFIKSVPKPAIDPAIIQARKEFLMSGIPEKMKIEIAKQKQFEETFEISLESMFPKISHVGREEREKSIEPGRSADWDKCGVIWREINSSPDRPIKSQDAANLIPFTPLKGPLAALGSLADVENKVDVVKNLKVLYSKFPTYRCYKQLRAKYKQTKNLAVQQVSDSFVILNTNVKTKDDIVERGVNGEQMFTEKYKPMTSDQFLVNYHPVSKLKEFLSSWQCGKFSKLDESSNDFDCSNDSIGSPASNTVVLYGPSSSGKTNAVFALANEMNFNVLEINAGMKRNGKKLLQELHEATQSHLVNNDKPNLFKRTLSGLKNKYTDENDSSSASELAGSAKLSLILVEDADIVFEQDSGFIDAIYQLISTSKRPVIIISNSAECPHLSRLQKQSSIEFPAPNVMNISKFLSVMSLVENCPVELDDIIRLYLFNKQHLRRTLLEMQFFIQSGGDRNRSKRNRSPLPSPQKFLKDDDSSGNENVVDDTESTYKPTTEDVYVHQSLFDFYTINQNSNCLVQFPVDFECLHNNLSNISSNLRSELPQPKKRGRPKKIIATKQSSGSLDDIVSIYDNISVASYISSNEIDDRLSVNTGELISHTLVEQTLRLKLTASTRMDLATRSKPKRPMLSHLLSQTCLRTNRSIDLDFEPALRMVCRSESARSQVERRGSRFYHYLRNICTSTNNFSTEEFEKTCSVLESTVENNLNNGNSKND